MVSTDLSSYSLEELIDMNSKLSVDRAEAAGNIKLQQLEVQKEIDKKQLEKRAASFSDDELKALIKMRKESPQTVVEPVEESANG